MTAEPARSPASLLHDLTWRGMIHAHTPGLPDRLATGRPIAGYNGFDPSGPSLHAGNLVPIFGLIQLQRHGCRPVALVGGATGMIGDPSGVSAERNLLDRDTIAANVAAIRGQLERFLDFSAGSGGALLVNNLDWLGDIGVLEFLRDVGKHFTVPYMLAKDSVQTRLERGLSYTEFSYMLLQATDYRHLYRAHGVELQMGGADQWGNITAGLELIRRSEVKAEGGADDELAHGLAYPLLLSPSGAKFGKTAEGTSVWLDSTRTSPFEFYQYWLNADDKDMAVYLRWFTLLSREEIERVEAEQAARPEERPAQRLLALDLTTQVHGPAAAERAVTLSRAAFGGEPVRDPALLADMYEVLDHCELDPADVAGGALRVAVACGLFASNGEARRAISQGGFSINDVRVSAPDEPVGEPIGGRWLLLRAGRKRLKVARIRRA
ncbi:MAG TPA: tyrosine--tRNA ligase [Candidatus Limnocylindria bacterium]|nr:tyrosine--tRNA ligase [Candidatus Limnocylindria bacterium]